MTREIVREVVLHGGRDARELFLVVFGEGVEDFIGQFHAVYLRFREIEGRVELDERSAWSQMFLYTALNSLATSTHLLVNGFLAPSGNLMRQFAESVGMALLLSHRAIDTFDRFIADPTRFSVNRSLDLVQRKENARVLDINREGWQDFREIASFYDQYSHASPLTAASTLMFSRPGGLAFGPSFDQAKEEMYQIEMSRRVTACDSTGGVVVQVEDQLLNSRA